MAATVTNLDLCPQCRDGRMLFAMNSDPASLRWDQFKHESHTLFATLPGDNDGWFCSHCGWFRSFLLDRQDAAELAMPSLVLPPREAPPRDVTIDTAETEGP